MSPSCPSYAVANATLTNSCAIQRSAITSKVTSALHTCCVGGGGPQKTSDGCFTYCNITSIYDGFHWNYCLLDVLGTGTFINIDQDALGCNDDSDDGGSVETSIPPGNIATTWVPTGQVFTLTESGKTYTQTLTSGGIFATPASSTGPVTSAATTTTGSSTSSQSNAAATTTSKSSGASNGASVSRFGAATIFGLFLYVALA